LTLLAQINAADRGRGLFDAAALWWTTATILSTEKHAKIHRIRNHT